MKQKTLDFEGPETLRRWRRKIQDEILQRAKIAPHLKRMLQKLRWYIGNNHECWPSLHTLTTELGYRWPQSKRTIIAQLDELRERGLIRTRRETNDKNGALGVNHYWIHYGRVQETYLVGKPPVLTPPRSRLTAGKRPDQTAPPWCNPLHHPGETRYTTLVKPVTPHKTNGKELKETKTGAEAATARNGTVGGGEFVKAPESAARPSGSWAGVITRASLAKPAEVVALYRAAVKAGILADTRLNRVRVVALAAQARRSSEAEIRSVGGYVIRHIERGGWNYLAPENVRIALSLLASDGLVLTKEEEAEVFQPVPVC